MNEVIEAIRSRRSIRQFSDREIPRDVLETIVNTSICAPSGKNLQTWRFTVLHTPERIAAFRQMVQEAAQRNHTGFHGFNNPKAVVIVSNDRDNADGIQDSACAVENMMLAAHSLGLGSVWVNALMYTGDDAAVREALRQLGIPEGHAVWCCLALGYPGEAGRKVLKKPDAIHWVD